MKYTLVLIVLFNNGYVYTSTGPEFATEAECEQWYKDVPWGYGGGLQNTKALWHRCEKISLDRP